MPHKDNGLGGLLFEKVHCPVFKQYCLCFLTDIIFKFYFRLGRGERLGFDVIFGGIFFITFSCLEMALGP